MNRLGLKKNRLWQRFQILIETRFPVRKNSSKDKEDDKAPSDEEALKIRKGILHDKQQSFQEESYFHKEEREQLKSLKQKLKGSQEEKSDKDEKK